MTCNFRNVALTMAIKHQKMIAYYLDTSSIFKSSNDMDTVTMALISNKFFCQRVPQLMTVLVIISLHVQAMSI